MTTMRAKMQLSSVENFITSERLSLRAVCESGGNPVDWSDEDDNFTRWTPSAELTVTVNNPALLGKFKAGDQFYVDFTPAE
ncbi:hypothetical protein FHW83_003301 [Duganella sp. SG902]|uniref:hypothetical protein n=1 Tax=Duganella sp. SG902 TaxID=2587016 RepID=UPI00159E5745|nr:hypothetical protein [Duganella sp. SG902]NVM77483.1 hypothetical protein [Duganella sp. SG902]